MHSLFLCSNRTSRSCGANYVGQLGDGTTTQRITPVQINGLSGIVAIECGGDHSIFLKSDGSVWACGYNSNGQLGDGTNTSRLTPVQVIGLCTVNTQSPISELQDQLIVFPNPGKGKFEIQSSAFQNQNVQLSIYNVLGERVYEKSVMEQGRSIGVDISNRPKGVYYLQVVLNQADWIKTKEEKIIVQ